MIDIRPFDSLGRFQNEWLNAHYHFSFANYMNPERTGIGPLLVWNDDEIQPGGGFPMHGHRNMEIITYVRYGAISHEDHLSNKGQTPAGDIQVMTAGKGIIHSEYNHEAEITGLYQIWIQPSETYLKPHWDQKTFSQADYAGGFLPLASGEKKYPNALPINQNATLYGTHLKENEEINQPIEKDRLGYLVVSKGSIELNGQQLNERDGAMIANEENLNIKALGNAELIFADLPDTVQ
ncbi:pirin family protein [uncultured Kiloniella sp.]|uniref:pirin family protein n=1 Tax=uncultured Kiloniella sp. TaxID=1133091 RepID=UPI0026342267|nr:pirin family protein [uncultured Kiloniella sp.]